MSWEVMSSDTKPCECGKGTVTHVMEMDDWNRIRNSMEIHCPDCRKKAARRADEQRRTEAQKERLYEQAKRLAIKRYLMQWLDGYEGLSSKAAWERYTGGSGYPALGTFYKHVKDAGGLAKYMRWCFENDIEGALKNMAVRDQDILDLLKECKSLK
jgi:hypothetical protein